jgi:hypothetical protein
LEWGEAVKRDNGLQGISPLEAARRLSVTEQEIGELMSGPLNVSDIVDDRGDVLSIVIPERDVRQYAVARQARQVVLHL